MQKALLALLLDAIDAHAAALAAPITRCMEAAAVPNAAPALRLGELLVRDGHATQEHVDQALELQPLLRKRLGEIARREALDDSARGRRGARRAITVSSSST